MSAQCRSNAARISRSSIGHLLMHGDEAWYRGLLRRRMIKGPAFTEFAETPWPHGARMPLTLEPPAGRAVRLDGGDTEDRVEGEAVEVPGRWSRARSAVRRREHLALHFRWPPALAVEASHRLQRLLICHPGRL